jgi:hypothetical protein
MATIHILGCHHALQSAELCRRWTDWRELYETIGKDVDTIARQQKSNFAARVREIVRDRAVTLIGEEFDEGVATSASLVVRNWHMIDMPLAVREERQIPVDYSDPLAGYTEEQRSGWNLERERFMVDQLVRNIGDAKSVLIICGAEHVEGLTRLFENIGHDVTSEDVTTAEWFDPPPG